MTGKMEAAVQELIAAEARPRIRTPVAVLVRRLPRRDERHVLREVEELERQGQPVVLVPLLGSRHQKVEETIRWSRGLLVAPLLSPALLRSVARSFVRGPRRFTTALLRLIAAHLLHPIALAKLLAFLPRTIHLAEELKRSGVRHVHAHSAKYSATLAWLMHEICGMNFSFTVHGPDVFTFRPLLEAKLAAARFVRSVSHFNEAYLRGMYPGLGDKLEIVRMGVNPELYERPAPAARRARPVILSVASFLPSKGLGFLVEACDALLREGVDFECRIIGDGPLRAPLQERIEELGAGHSIRLLGSQPWEEVVREMKECDVFVLPGTISHDGQMDGIPVSAIEAMAAGRPVVAAAISGIPELVTGSGILVDSTHPARIAHAIRHLLERPDLRERMGRSGPRRVRAEFDLRRNVSALIQLFDEHGAAAPIAAADDFDALNIDELRGTAVAVRAMHRRNDSIVAEITATDVSGARDLVVKQHRGRAGQSRPPHERARHERDVLEMLGRSLPLADSPVALSVPRVTGYDPGRAVLAMSRAAGDPLDRLVRQHRFRPGADAALAASIRGAGAWLRGLQQTTRCDDDGRYVLTAVVVTAERDLDVAAAVDHSLLRRREWIVEHLRMLEIHAADSVLPVIGHHGDYWPGNVFVREGAVEVIDFEGYREGLPLEDVAWFLVHLRLQLAFPGMGRLYARLAEAFLDGYSGSSETLDRRTLRLLTATKALHVLARGAAGAPRGLRLRLRRRLLRDIVMRSLE